VTASRQRNLTRHIGLGQGIALYTSAILGAGVLSLPGQVASLAGPASLVSWGFECLMGVPLAAMFAALARRYPDAGGIATYVGHAFGPTTGGVAGWLYFVAGSVGQAIVPLTGGYYLTEALQLDGRWSYVIAAAILAAATIANLAGVRLGARVQLSLAAAVGLLLTVTVLLALPQMSVAKLTPFAPHGIAPIGQGVIVLYFAFAGWEAVAHLVGEFRDPNRDVRRAVTATIGIVSVLYLGTAAAVVLTGTYGDPGTDHVAIGLLLRTALGGTATLVAAVGALIISLGTTNAFIAGVSRLAYSLARDRWLPAPVARVAPNGIPVGGVLAVAGVAGAGVVLAMIFGWGTETLVVVPSVLVVTVYLLAAASGVKLLSGPGRVAAIATVILTLFVVPSVMIHLAIPAIVVAVALLARAWYRRRNGPTP
jgi:amino acid efflux transporter